MSDLYTKLQNIESMLEEMDLRIQGTVPEDQREYLYSGIRTIRNDLYPAMRLALDVEPAYVVEVDADGFELELKEEPHGTL